MEPEKSTASANKPFSPKEREDIRRNFYAAVDDNDEDRSIHRIGTFAMHIPRLLDDLDHAERENKKMRNAVEDDWRDKETVIGIVRNVLIAKVYSQDGYVIGIPIDQDVRDVARKEAIAHAIKIFSTLPQS